MQIFCLKMLFFMEHLLPEIGTILQYIVQLIACVIYCRFATVFWVVLILVWLGWPLPMAPPVQLRHWAVAHGNWHSQPWHPGSQFIGLNSASSGNCIIFSLSHIAFFFITWPSHLCCHSANRHVWDTRPLCFFPKGSTLYWRVNVFGKEKLILLAWSTQ